MQLMEIDYPVFKLSRTPPIEDMGVVFYYSYTENGEGDRVDNLRVVDNKNLPGDTLAARRLQMLSQGVKLYNIRQAIFFLADLVKLSHSDQWFIDSSGKLFKYTKSQYAKLIYKRIKTIIPIPTGGAIIEVHGIPERFKTLFLPSTAEIYAGVVQFGRRMLFYGVSDRLHKDRRIKI